MNLRIKELLSEAKIYDGSGSKTQAITTCPRDLEKFAELIVRECAKIAGKAEYSDTWLEPVEDAIKKHFGVEE